MIDDFSTGSYRSDDLRTGAERSTQTGSMLGGNRTTFIAANTGEGNPLQQPVVVDIGATGEPVLVVSSGYRARHVLQSSWGLPDNHLNANLSCYDRFRVHFDGISGGGLGLVMEVVARNTNNSVGGCAQQYTQRGPFIAEFPFSCFHVGSGLPDPDFGQVTRITMQTDGRGAPVAGASFGMTKIELAAPATTTTTRFCILGICV